MYNKHCHIYMETTWKNKLYHKILKNSTSISQEQSSHNIISSNTHTQKCDNVAVFHKLKFSFEKNMWRGLNYIGNWSYLDWFDGWWPYYLSLWKMIPSLSFLVCPHDQFMVNAYMHNVVSLTINQDYDHTTQLLRTQR